MKLSLFALAILSASAITLKKDSTSISNCNSSIRPKCVTEAVTAADRDIMNPHICIMTSSHLDLKILD